MLFFDLSLFSSRKIEDDMEVEEFYDVYFTEIGKSELLYYLENGGATSYLWMNDKMEIEKVVIWGISTVTET